jgi:hypothetical protein
MNYQQINSDGLEGAIRKPIQQEGIVGRDCSGSVCSLRTRQASHVRVSDGCRVKDYTEELLGFKEDNEFTQPVQ